MTKINKTTPENQFLLNLKRNAVYNQIHLIPTIIITESSNSTAATMAEGAGMEMEGIITNIFGEWKDILLMMF